MRAVKKTYYSLPAYRLEFEDLIYIVGQMRTLGEVVLKDRDAEFDDLDDLVKHRSGPLEYLDLKVFEKPGARGLVLQTNLASVDSFVHVYEDQGFPAATAIIERIRDRPVDDKNTWRSQISLEGAREQLAAVSTALELSPASQVALEKSVGNALAKSEKGWLKREVAKLTVGGVIGLVFLVIGAVILGWLGLG